MEAQNGSIDENKLLSYARAFDKEDGEIAGRRRRRKRDILYCDELHGGRFHRI